MESHIEYLTPHFRRVEMQCPCCGKCEMDSRFMEALEAMRDYLSFPLKINSGYRCKEHNDSLPGSSKSSWHMQGMAADISWDEFSPFTKKKTLETACRLFGGVGIARTYMHVDLGPAKLWIY